MCFGMAGAVGLCASALVLNVFLVIAITMTVGFSHGGPPIKPAVNCSCPDGKDGSQGPPGPRGPPGPPGPRGPEGSGSSVVIITGTTYTRWGNNTCLNGKEMSLVYSGIVVGQFFHRVVGLVFSSEPMCFPSHYEAVENLRKEQDGGTPVLPCSVCYAKGRSTSLMIPGQHVCPLGWTKEYRSYIMTNLSKFNHLASYLCVDSYALQAPNFEKLGLYTFRVDDHPDLCNRQDCHGKKMECVVCSK